MATCFQCGRIPVIPIAYIRIDADGNTFEDTVCERCVDDEEDH